MELGKNGLQNIRGWCGQRLRKEVAMAARVDEWGFQGTGTGVGNGRLGDHKAAVGYSTGKGRGHWYQDSWEQMD